MNLLNFKSVTFRFTLFLLFFGCISLIDHLIFATDGTPKSYYFINLSLITSICIFWYFLLKAFKNVRLNYLHLTITGIILFLLIHPTTSWDIVVLTVFITLILKTFVRYKGSPIFNPANMGLFVSFYVTYVLKKFGIVNETVFISWWGADLLRSIWERNVLVVVPILLLSSFMYYVWKFRKQNHAISFLLTYLAATAVMFATYKAKNLSVDFSILYRILVSSFGFLVLVMVAEPKTSPILPHHQIWLGVVGGLIMFWITFYMPVSWDIVAELDPFVLGLVILNILTFMTKYISNRKPIVIPTTSAPIKTDSSLK